MEKDYKAYIKDLSVYDLADEFNTQTFIVNDKEKFNEVLLIDHFENADYIESLETQLKKQKEINKKAVEYIKNKENGKCIHNGIEKGAYTFVLDFDKAREFIWELLEILEDKEV